jgi:hypothetical protein
MALATATSASVVSPVFADVTTGNLATTVISTNLAWLVELRCLSNMLNPGTLGEVNQMRADELATLTSTTGAI